jgi:hypothetical protein
MAASRSTDVTPRETLSSSAAERRTFLRRAALIGIPVVIATVPGRTAWAGTKPKEDKPPKDGDYTTPLDDPTGAMQGSFHASGTTNTVPSLL